MATKNVKVVRNKVEVTLGVEENDPPNMFLRTELMSGKRAGGVEVEVCVGVAGKGLIIAFRGPKGNRQYVVSVMDLVELLDERYTESVSGKGVRRAAKS